ncbi:efflux RND transporter periplasmic adaptor subunit [Nitrospira sp. MA-1]|nr:efflux RND transporter periplasmic adaptor subunit [Nitrospira sp. MA-1]
MNNSIRDSVLILFLLIGVACQDRPTPPAPEETSTDQEQRLQSDTYDEQNRQGESDQHEREKHSEEIILAPEALEGQAFQTVVVERGVVREGIQATANIQPNAYTLTHVSPRIEGKAIKVIAELGDLVKLGETLAILDSIELGSKKSAFRQARTVLQVNKANYAREKRLFAQQISSEKDYLDARGAYQQSVAAYQAAFEALELVGLSHKDIEAIIENKGGHHPLSSFSLTAAQKGTIIERHVTPGELITPRDKPFTIADLSTVWILLDIFEKDLAGVRVGANVRISVDAYPGEVFRGTVVYLSNLLDPGTRTVEARVEIPNPKGRLRPGMFARSSIAHSGSQGKEVLRVSQEAVQHIEEQPVAFVEKKLGTYAKRGVTLGANDDPYVEIVSGLQEGERVVTKGSFYLKSILLGEALGGHGH